MDMFKNPNSRANPGFFLGGGAPLRNDVSDRWVKQILKANTKKASSQGGGGGGVHPCTLPLDLPLQLSAVRIQTSWLFRKRDRGFELGTTEKQIPLVTGW